jgi:hypothetical protein
MTLNTNKIRTFEMIVNVSGPLAGELSDWPAKIQDGIYEAMERKAEEVKLPLAVVRSGCEHDVDEGYYLRVILSEIITADERMIKGGGLGDDGFIVDAPNAAIGPVET